LLNFKSSVSQAETVV